MSEQLAVEATGETVGEAKWKALRELERLVPALDKAAVTFQVVSEGERGLLGVGYVPARVIATTSASARPAPIAEPRGDETENERRIRELVERVAGAIGLASHVEAHESGDELLVTCTGGDLALLIGRHGQTIDALQYVANAIMHRDGATPVVTIDAAGYRDRRRATLEGIADRAAERAVAGDRVPLEPMTAVERKVVHERLKDVEGIATASEGTEPNRYIVVFPAA